MWRFVPARNPSSWAVRKVVLGNKKSSRPARGGKKSLKKSFPPPPKLNSNPNQTGNGSTNNKQKTQFVLFIVSGGGYERLELRWSWERQDKDKKIPCL